ncbi:PA14 domain-containing protein [Carboxylicivirga caseinilyticus]|uniref:PA14 domain-containing protein n=1 Tax=Carboxylicivirga caseinilyticus TaxID=3417572 RepID=UPI003D34A838|nr:baseplate wedge protein 53 [Marinilabiliaceae bacterium A049]
MQKITITLLFSLILSSISFAQTIDRVEGSPFKASSMPDTLFIADRNMSASEQFTVGSLSGILARTKPMILQQQYFHEEIVKNSDLDIKYYSITSNNLTNILRFFKSKLDGYILCDPQSRSSNVAASLSGIFNAVAIPTDIESKAITAGLTKVLDVTGKNELWAYMNYKDLYNKDVAFFLSPDDWTGLVDYTAYTGGIRFYDSNINGSLTDSVYNFLNPGAMFYGWWVSEDGSVGRISENSYKIIPSGGLKNLATFTNIDVPIKKQKEVITPYESKEDVHTVCFVISDGDNISWPVGSAYWDLWTWKNENQSHINLGWTLSPALTELTPIIYNDLVQGLQTTLEGRNVAIASPSGLGYYFPSLSPNNPDHCAELNKFMRKADMNIVNVIDTDDGAHNPDEYLKQSNIDALFYYTYGQQYQGMHGAISWYKGKPSIGGRYVFWGNSEDRSAETQDVIAQRLADLLNTQSTDIHSEEGYSLVPVHIWTMNPHDVANVISKLNPNIRVVAPDEFVWLIKKNIGGLPVGTGNGLNAEYYNDNIFGNLTDAKVDNKIDFDWGLSTPTNSTTFSAKWTGQIQPLYSDDYTFFITSDGGTKLTVNGSVLFDSSDGESTTTKSGNITLSAGEKYDISIEYAEGSGNSMCLLEWESVSQLRQIVPFTQLYAQPISTTGVVTVYDETNNNGFSAGLKIGTYTESQLAELGMSSDEISSIQLMEGFKAILFDEDNFAVDSIEITSDEADLSAILMSDNTSDWNNRTSSIKIRANGDPTISGAFFLKNKSSNYYMDVRGGESATDYNTTIQQYSFLNNNNQVFHFFHKGDGVYELMARHSKMMVSIAKTSIEENANVHQWKDFGSLSQKFIAVPAGDNTYKFVSIYSGKVINAASNSIEANVQMNSNIDQDLGKWILQETINREGTGNGLKGEYFNGTNFSSLQYTQIDPQIKFDWGESTPGAPVSIDNFSVRWTGYIEPRYSGTYTFYIDSDNGRRLWVNNQLVIDKWIGDWGTVYTGTIYLQEMTKYDIKLEYFEETGGANIKFYWSSSKEVKEIVPQSQLYSELPTEISNKPTTGLKIYPNPVSNTLFIDALNEPTQLEIYNLQGCKVLQSLGKSINTESLAKGMYFLMIHSDEVPQTFKFIKK